MSSVTGLSSHPREGEQATLAVSGVLAQQQAAVGLAVDVLEHLALAAARRALVHEHDVVVVRRGDADGRAVGGGPALLLAEVQQHAVDALLRGRPRVEVVAEQLVQPVGAVVHDDLPALEVRVAEGGRGVEIAPGSPPACRCPRAGDALEHREPEREEPGVGGRDRERGRALLAHARGEREDRERLRGEPLERLRPRRVERLAEPLV
jgi:hypothetical protein